jgi:hypothetical protein
MKARRRRGRAALVALVLAALAIPALALAVKPKPGPWAGRTDQDHAISFKVNSSRTKVKNLKVELDANCTSGSINVDREFQYGVRIRDSKFSFRGDDTKVNGKFTTRRRAKGTVRLEGTFPLGGDCDSGKRDWTARPD